MAHAQFICHQLVSVFTMGFAKVLMQHNAVDNSAATIHAIHQKKCQPGNIVGFHNQATNHKQEDKSHSNATYVTGKALGFVLWTKIEETENQHGENNHHNQAFIHKLILYIQ